MLGSLSDQTEARELKTDMQQVGDDDGSKAEETSKRLQRSLVLLAVSSRLRNSRMMKTNLSYSSVHSNLGKTSKT